MQALAPVPAAIGASVVRVTNASPNAYHGWLELNTDQPIPFEAGEAPGFLFVRGGRTGLDTHRLHVRVALDPGERRELQLHTAEPTEFALGSPMSPHVALMHFGGPLTINGAEAQWVELRADGAGYRCHLRANLGRMFTVDVWFTWYPSQPAWCAGTASVVGGRQGVEDLTEVVPPQGIVIAFGDAIVLVLGQNMPGLLVAPGTVFAHGQARADLPLTFLWLRHVRGPEDLSSIGAMAFGGVVGHGIRKLLDEGNPRYSPGFSALAWARGRLREAARKAHTWEPGVCGPMPNSGVTGAQEDQVFVRGEALLPDGEGAVLVTRLSAARLGCRPCHFLEVDGSPLDLARHPHLTIWMGRPHFITADRLGKPIGLVAEQVPGGWWGSDVEHKLYNTLAAGVRLTGSPALQALLAQRAKLYMRESTTQAGLSTSAAYASRAVGYESAFAIHCWRELEDRALAQQVREHYLRRVDLVLLPQLRPVADIYNGWVDVRTDDPRLGPGKRAMPWQHSLFYFMARACELFEHADGRAFALRVVRAVMRDAFVLRSDRWTTLDVMVLDGGADAAPAGMTPAFREAVVRAAAEDSARGETLTPMQEALLEAATAEGVDAPEAPAVTEGYFDLFGNPLAPATILRYVGEDAQARAAWQQLLAAATQPQQLSWFAPGVQ